MSEQEQQEQQEQEQAQERIISVEFILFAGDPHERMEAMGMFSADVKAAEIENGEFVTAYGWESEALEWLADPERTTPLELRDGPYWITKRPEDGTDDYYLSLRRVTVSTSRYFRNW